MEPLDRLSALQWARYATFHHTKEPSMPPENLLLFYVGVPGFQVGFWSSGTPNGSR